MAIKPKKTVKPKGNKSVALFEELDFISVVCNKDIPSSQFACFNNGRLTATNNKITAGIKTDVDITARPQITQLLEAIRNCPAEFAMTQIDAGKIFVKSGKFTATIPCLPEELPGYTPDAPCAPISDALKDALEIVAPFSMEGAKKVILGSGFIKKGSVTSTDGEIILESWHGIDLPQLIIPKSFISAILESKKPLARFGFSNSSVTIFFEDNSWIRTQLHNEQWPDTDKILNVVANPIPLPEGFYKALIAIEPFSKTGNVYFGEGCLQSHRDKSEGAVYEVPGVKFGPCFSIKQLKRIEPFMSKVDFYSQNYAIFYGDKTRGVLGGVLR